MLANSWLMPNVHLGLKVVLSLFFLFFLNEQTFIKVLE